MSAVERLQLRTPLRLGEFARLIGYSREQVRKLVKAKVVKTVCLRGGVERRVPPDEAERIFRELRLI